MLGKRSGTIVLRTCRMACWISLVDDARHAEILTPPSGLLGFRTVWTGLRCRFRGDALRPNAGKCSRR